MAEVSVFGVFFPAFLLWALMAFGIYAAARRVFDVIGVYRFVWHRALFDLGVYVILLGGVVGLASRIVGP